MPKDLDLDLKSSWFTKRTINLPSPITNNGCNTLRLSINRTLLGLKLRNELVVAVLRTDELLITKIRLSWNSSNPRNTVRAEQRHSSPPKLELYELRTAHVRYGINVLEWCMARLGKRVGDGECWSLAYEALQAKANALKRNGFEPVMVSQGRIHGYCIFERSRSSAGSISEDLQAAGVAGGDILEMTEARFCVQSDLGPAGKVRAGRIMASQHTAVITGVDGTAIKVLEQNTERAHGKVCLGSYDLKGMESGVIQIYRPVREGWIDLSPVW